MSLAGTSSAPICDAHHHLGHSPSMTYGLDELCAEMASTGGRVIASVFVESSANYRTSGPRHLRPVGETEWVPSLAPWSPVRGIVGHVDLRKGAVSDVLAAHVDAGRGYLRGVRHRAIWDRDPSLRRADPDPGPELLRDLRFRQGFAAVSAAGLSFDAWVYFHQLPEVAELAAAYPDAAIVVDHCGGPVAAGPYGCRRDDVLAAWRSAIVAVARRPNVFMKLRGFGMPTFGCGWTRTRPPATEEVAERWRDVVRWCIDAFGAYRCMFESNFPVDAVSMSYATLWEACASMVADASPSERAELFHATATRFYRLVP